MMETTHPPETEQAINLAEYYHLLLKNKWLIIGSVIIAILVAFWHNSGLVPIYSATATMIFDKPSGTSPLTGRRMDYESYLSESMTFKTHFELIKSQEVMERVIKKLNLDQEVSEKEKEELGETNPFKKLLAQFKTNVYLLFSGKNEKKLPVTREDRLVRLARSLGAMVRVGPVEDTRLVKIRVRSPLPNRAMDIANATAESYIEFNTDNRMKASENTLGWLTDHLFEIKMNLEEAESEFLTYKQTSKLISMEDSQKLIAQKISDFNDAYLKARNKRVELDAKLARLGGVSSGGDTPHLRSLVANELINALHGQLVNAEVTLSRLSKIYKSKHPKVIQVKTKIENVRRKLHEEVRKEVDSLKAERDVLKAKERVLQKTVSDFKKEGMNTNKKQLRYTILKRNVEMNQRMYDAILTRLKETNITGNVDVSNIRIVEKALLPTLPVSPHKTRNLMLGLVFGLIIGLGLGFLRGNIDRTLRTEEDIQKYLGLPILSVIPMAELADGKPYYGSYGSGRSEKSNMRKAQSA
ncbi:MAG: GumC family protein [Deltaproteobacteria bacterium]|nr:GumC family protein [Deltaproteobacteria bacterium]